MATRVRPKDFAIGNKYQYHNMDDDASEQVLMLQTNYQGPMSPKDKDGNPKKSAVMRCLEELPADESIKMIVRPYSFYGKKWELFEIEQ